ncbi:hypothetical protein LRS03_08985 [Rhizobacter sp. J219]|uniref:hypothetical protein n=1 Tax=Rhizobacter sp. J219 TaxID=2898430 RepID=UPI002150BB81|nr:hypothetical protein [Rhizobacter sp. J219]MCR5882983.1 hypothetical protein [Rhizobacter sp. J219]
MGPNEGDTLHEVECGQHQELLGVGAHLQQVVVTEVSVDEREQVALGMLVAEVLDDLVDQVVGRRVRVSERRFESNEIERACAGSGSDSTDRHQ